jgi:hypothetical protein
MADFLLRDIDPALWRKVKAQAAKDGRTLRQTILRLLKEYVEKGGMK